MKSSSCPRKMNQVYNTIKYDFYIKKKNNKKKQLRRWIGGTRERSKDKQDTCTFLLSGGLLSYLGYLQYSQTTFIRTPKAQSHLSIYEKYSSLYGKFEENLDSANKLNNTTS